MKTAKFSTSSFIKSSLCILALVGASQSVSADVKFRIGYEEATQNYVVYMAPLSVPNPDRSISSQVTIAVPHLLDSQRFAVTNISQLISGAVWSAHSRVDAPVESPYNDFISFGFNFSSNGLPAFNWQVGQETAVFSFQNPNGGCVDGVRLLDNNEAFNQLPNSTNTNPGNEFSNLGWTVGYTGNYGSTVNCSDLGAPVIIPTPENTVTPAPTPTPEPTPVPTPEPTPVPTPEPTPVPTPEPTPVPTPEPTPVPTPEPTPVPTPEPTPVPTPEPTPVPTPEPTPVPTPEPTPVPTPEPTPVPTPHPVLGWGSWIKPVPPILQWFPMPHAQKPVIVVTKHKNHELKVKLSSTGKLPYTACNPVAAASAKKMLKDIDHKLENKKLSLFERLMLQTMRESFAKLACDA